MPDEWAEQETGTHQDHVIAHVIGATVQGHFAANETAYLLLDIGFIWLIYLDGEMGLVPQGMALAEMELDEAMKAELRDDVWKLQSSGGGDQSLSHFAALPAGCLITEVRFYTRADERKLIIKGEDASLALETSLATGEIFLSFDGSEK